MKLVRIVTEPFKTVQMKTVIIAVAVIAVVCFLALALVRSGKEEDQWQ